MRLPVSLSFLSIAFIAAVAAASFKQIESDLDLISDQINHDISQFSQIGNTGIPTLTDALTLHSQLQVLSSTIKQAASDSSGSLSTDEQGIICSKVKALEPAYNKFVDVCKSKKSVLSRLVPYPVTTVVSPVKIVQNDFVQIHDNEVNLFKKLGEITPTCKGELEATGERIIEATSSLIKYYG